MKRLKFRYKLMERKARYQPAEGDQLNPRLKKDVTAWNLDAFAHDGNALVTDKTKPAASVCWDEEDVKWCPCKKLRARRQERRHINYRAKATDLLKELLFKLEAGKLQAPVYRNLE